MTTIAQTNISKIQKFTKYILIGLIVILATNYIPDNKLQLKEIIMIGATSSISFAILDMVSPAVSIQTNSYTKTQPKVVVEAFTN